MAQKETHKKAASSAGKVLQDKKATKDQKAAAGSALSQREHKGKKK